MKYAKATIILFGTVLLLAPSIAEAFQYDVLGTLDTSCKMAIGKVQHSAFSNQGQIAIYFKDEHNQCRGTFKMNGYNGKNPFSVKDMAGDAQLTCTDGSAMEATPIADSIRRGHGHGIITRPDGRKESFYFVFSTHAKDTPNLLSQFLQRLKTGCKKEVEPLKCQTALH
jgi:hypothetical protein